MKPDDVIKLVIDKKENSKKEFRVEKLSKTEPLESKDIDKLVTNTIDQTIAKALKLKRQEPNIDQNIIKKNVKSELLSPSSEFNNRILHLRSRADVFKSYYKKLEENENIIRRLNTTESIKAVLFRFVTGIAIGLSIIITYKIAEIFSVTLPGLRIISTG